MDMKNSEATKGTKMTITKGQLTEKRTLVVYRGETYVVKDLMQRKSYNKPTRIGIGPLDRGIAFSVELSEVTIK